MTEFWAMGGHGAFIWGAYAVAVIVLGGLGLASLRGYLEARAQVARLEAQAGRGRG